MPRHRCRVKHCGRIGLAAFAVAGAILQLSNFNREQATGSSLRCLSIVNLLSVCERRIIAWRMARIMLCFALSYVGFLSVGKPAKMSFTGGECVPLFSLTTSLTTSENDDD